MTTYAFSEVLVYAQVPGGQLRLLKNGSVQVLDATGSPALGTGALLATVTADSNGAATFTTTDKPVVDVKDPSTGYVRRVASTDAIVAAANSVPSNDTAVTNLINNSSSTTRGALDGRYAKSKGRDVNVWDYSVVGDGATDDTAAVQQALNDAGSGGRVLLSKGTFGQARFKCGPLKMPAAFMTISGGINAVGTGSTSPMEIVQTGLASRSVTDAATTNASATLTSATAAFTGSDVGSAVYATGIPLGTVIQSVTNATTVVMSANATATASALSLTVAQVGLTMNSSCLVENILFRNNSYSNGTVGFYSAYPTCRLRGVQFNTYGVAGFLVGVWYGTLTDVESRSCGTFLNINNCYNLRLRNPQVNGTNGAAYGQGIVMASQNMVDIEGGAIENTQTGITMSGLSSLTMRGTYWETAATNAVGVKASGVNGHLVSVRDCQVYINNYTAWIDFQTTDSGTLDSSSNYFKATGPSTPTAPVAYAFDAAPTSEIALGLGGPDNWRNVALNLAAALYTNRDGTRLTRVSAVTPAQYTGSSTDAGALRIGRDIRVPSTKVIVTGAAATASRPDPVAAGIGAMFYDSTLAKPIWSTGTGWRDATGTAV